MKLTLDRVIGLAAVVVVAVSPLLFGDYFVTTTLTTTLYLGIAAASLIYLSAYGGMVSLSQVALAGIAGFTYGNIVANGGSKGLNLGYSPWIGILLRHPHRDARRPALGAIASRSTGIYVSHDHARLLGDRLHILRARSRSSPGSAACR